MANQMLPIKIPFQSNDVQSIMFNQHFQVFHFAIHMKFATRQEDFLYQCKKIGVICRGLDPVGMMDRFFDKYRLNLTLRWERRRRTGQYLVSHR